MSEMASAADTPEIVSISRGFSWSVERGDDNLDFVAETLGEQRTHGPVGQSVYEDGVRAGPALTTEEASGNLAPGIKSFLKINSQGEEIYAFSGLCHGGGDQ
jgi:hypothetical protein